jgi:glutaredoxin
MNRGAKMHRFSIPILLTMVLALGCGGASQEVRDAVDDTAQTDAGSPDVTMVVFIMARCPHCADLLKTLLPLKKELGDSVALSFAWIGLVDEEGRADLSYGDAEVKSAEIQLCAGLNSATEQWLDFMECLYEGERWHTLPRGWTSCAKKVGIDVAAVTTCIDEGNGEIELERSIEVAAARGIEGAPALFINGRHYMGEHSRKSILSHVCHTAEVDDPPEICSGVSPLATLPTTLLVDPRCDDPAMCDVTREVTFLNVLFPTLALKVVNYPSPEGKRLYKLIRAANGPRQIPLLIFDDALDEFPREKAAIGEYLIPFGEGYLMSIGLGWDPSAEICDNEIDDNEDGATDCLDEGCTDVPGCREEQPGRLDIFIMSRCPFAMHMIPEAKRFADHVSSHGEKIDLHLQFIGNILEGELDSMHGEPEVAEDLRMICAEHLYRKKNLFMDYVACRAQNYLDADWEACIPKGMSTAKISKCAQGETGRKLLEASFSLATKVGIAGSPSGMLNNNFEMNARDAAGILEAFCARNDRPVCKMVIEPVEGDSRGPLTDKCQ